MPQRRAAAWVRWGRAAVVLAALTSCEVLPAPEIAVRAAVRAALPDLVSFELVTIDDAGVIGQLDALAAGGDGTSPIHLELPVIDSDGRLTRDFVWTAYPHDVRVSHPDFGGTPVFALADPAVDERLDLLGDVLPGPSRTFQGVPVLDAEAFARLLADATNRPEPFDELEIQASVLNVLTGAGFPDGELEGAYYGPRLQAPSVIQGIRSLLANTLEPAVLNQLLSGVSANYVVYNHVAYQPGLEHIEEVWTDGAAAAPLHGHGDDAAASRSTIETSSHFLESGFRTVHVVPVADDTIYDPDTQTWLFDGWFARMEAAVNRMDLFNTFVNLHPDHAGDAMADNNGFILRARIPEFRVLTTSGKDRLVPHPATGCGEAGSYRDAIRQLSGAIERYPNEYWQWSTQDDFSGGGCSYTQVLDLTPRGGTECGQIDNRGYASCGAVGYIELRSGHTQDWTSLVVIHEAGHAMNGRHDNDAYGSGGESDDSQRCRFLGIWEFGPTGPSIMSYAGGTTTYCFAWTPTEGAPRRNTSIMATWLHEVVD